jgi:hypothetical protein
VGKCQAATRLGLLYLDGLPGCYTICSFVEKSGPWGCMILAHYGCIHYKNLLTIIKIDFSVGAFASSTINVASPVAWGFLQAITLHLHHLGLGELTPFFVTCIRLL